MFVSYLNKIESINVHKNVIDSSSQFKERLQNAQSETAHSSRAGQRRLKAGIACGQNNLLFSQKIEEDIADILQKYGQGDAQQAIFRAAEAGDKEAIIKLLDYGVAYETEIKIERKLVGPLYKRWSVTDFACKSKNIDLLKYLIQEKKIKAYEPLYILIQNKEPYWEGIDLFLSEGYLLPSTILLDAFYESRGIGSDLEKNKVHNTYDPLPLPRIETVKSLIERGALTNCLKAPHNMMGIIESIWHVSLHNTYLPDRAISDKAREMIKFLLSQGLNPNQASKYLPYTAPKDLIGYPASYSTPLLVAIQNKDVELISALLNAGADPNLKGSCWYWGFQRAPHPAWKWTWNRAICPIQLALDNEDKAIVALLIEYSAKI